MGEGGAGVFTERPGYRNASKYFPGNTARMGCVVNQWKKKADVMIYYSLDHTMADSVKYD